LGLDLVGPLIISNCADSGIIADGTMDKCHWDPAVDPLSRPGRFSKITFVNNNGGWAEAQRPPSRCLPLAAPREACLTGQQPAEPPHPTTQPPG
jgi:hypothetical protein